MRIEYSPCPAFTPSWRVTVYTYCDYTHLLASPVDALLSPRYTGAT